MPSRTAPSLPDIETLVSRVRSARLQGTPPDLADRARRMLVTYLETARDHGIPAEKVVHALAEGSAALQLGGFALDAQRTDPPEALTRAACAAGCAFCCILSGRDGGTVTRVEARRLHAALAPHAGEADGRDWHPRACPALDPATRKCRAYDARPMVCRAYFSVDADACVRNADGRPTPGAALLSAHAVYLAVHALARAALGGVVKVSTYSLADLAAATVDGRDEADAIRSARQRPRALDDERRRALN